jgi:septal ring factor EnvC (AmiA/AmiB activator)
MTFATDRILFRMSTGVIGLSAFLLFGIDITNASSLENAKNARRRLTQFEQQLKQTELTLATYYQKSHLNQEKSQQLNQQQKILTNKKLKLTAERKQQTQQIAQWIDWLYRQNSDRTVFIHWLSNDSLEQQDRQFQYYRYLHAHYQRQYEEWQATETEWQRLNHQLSSQQQKQKVLSVQTQHLITQTKQQKKERQHSIHQLKKIVLALDKKQTQQRIEQQRLKTSQLTNAKNAEKQTIEKPSPLVTTMLKQKGQLPWPLKGSLRHHFNEQHPDKWKWKGWVINGESGQAIHTIARGKIVFADWLSGYGLLIVVDHGDHLMSLYGYNRSLTRTLGETVQQGEILAYVGNTGGQQISGLYFELRQKGKPINPKRWLISR